MYLGRNGECILLEPVESDTESETESEEEDEEAQVLPRNALMR